jgi:hypothetical protein
MTQIFEIIQSPIFARQKKKLHKKQIKDLDKAVKSIYQHPDIGVAKTGDLQGVRVFKFKSSLNRYYIFTLSDLMRISIEL